MSIVSSVGTAIPRGLKKAIENDSLVIFAGAGTSRPLGLPNWEELVIKILEQLQEENSVLEFYIPLIRKKELSPFMVLNQLVRYRRTIYEMLDYYLDLSKQSDYSTHKLVLSLSERIITTNYDKAFEFAQESAYVISNDDVYKFAKLSKSDQYVFKIHGDIISPDKCVLFEDDYERLYKDKESAFLLELKILFIQKTILFIGFSLNDPYIEYVITSLYERYKSLNREHYIITDDERFSESRYQDMVHAITIPDYSHLKEKIEELVSYKNQVRPSSIMNQKPIINLQPRSYNNLIGRKTDLEEVFIRMAKPLPVTVIGGLPGTGKSSLALEIGYISSGLSNIQVQNSISFDYVIWISLHDLQGEQEVTSSIFDEIGRISSYTKINQLNLKEKWRDVNNLIKVKRFLLILDNFEENDDKQLEEWIQTVPLPSKILIVSLKNMVFPHNYYELKGVRDDYFNELISEEASNLGINVSRYLRGDLKKLFEITSGNPRALQLVMGLIRQGALNIQDVESDELNDIFEKLYKKSWNLLSQNSRELLKLFPLLIPQNSIDRNALFEISNMTQKDANEALKELCNWNLLSVNSGDQLYTIHPTLIRFLNKQELMSYDQGRIRLLFIKYYLKLVEQTIVRDEIPEKYWNVLVSPKMENLEKDWPSILQAMHWAAEEPVKAELLEFVLLLVHFLDSRFYNQERLRFVNDAIKTCSHVGKNQYKYEESLLKIDALSWTYVEEDKLVEANRCLVDGYRILKRHIPHEKARHLIALAQAWLARIKIEILSNETDLLKSALSKDIIEKQSERLIEKAKKYLGNAEGELQHEDTPGERSEHWIASRIYMAAGDISFKQATTESDSSKKLKKYLEALELYQHGKKRSDKYGGEGYDYQINPRIGLALLSTNHILEAQDKFQALRANHKIYIGKLYGEYGLALVTCELGQKEEGSMMIKKVEEEITQRSNSNLLLKLIKQYKKDKGIK